MKTAIRSVLVFPALLHAAAALTVGQTPSAIVVREAWVRELLPTRTATGAYAIIENRTGEDMTLVAARATRVRVVELHEMRMEGEAMRMRKVDRVVIPAKGTVTLEPGGLHLMLIGVESPLAPGDVLTLTLEFSDGTVQQVQAPVRPARASGPMPEERFE